MSQPEDDRPLSERRTANAEEAGRILMAWSDSYNLPAILTTKTGSVLWANASAVALLEDSEHLRIRGDRLVCVDGGQEASFREALDSLSSGSVTWICRGRDDHLLVRAERIEVPGADPAVGINLFPTTVSKRNYQWGDFGDLFGLTAAEVGVAKMLVGGDRAEEAAVTLGVSLETVRTHVRRIYGKLNINSREQLFSAISAFRTH